MSPAPIVPRDRRPTDVEAYLLLPEVKALFWSRVKIGGVDECWTWTAGRHVKGYGNFWNPYKGYGIRASRVAFFYKEGFFPLEGRHTCDNPPCCNPGHIIDGTHRENMQDCIARGRFPSGQRCGMAKLTPEQVLAILNDGRSSRKIAADYGITKSSVGALKRGESYKEISR